MTRQEAFAELDKVKSEQMEDLEELLEKIDFKDEQRQKELVTVENEVERTRLNNIFEIERSRDIDYMQRVQK